MAMTPEERAAYDAECEAHREQGYMTLREATRELDMHDAYVRTLVRQNKLTSVRDSRNRIWVHEDVVAAKLEATAERRARAELRKEGKLPKYAYTYVPAPIQHVKQTMAYVEASDFDEETKGNVNFVLGEILNAKIAEQEAKAAAEAEAEE